MNIRNILRILVIGLFVSSLTAGVVSAAPGTYDYTYEIDGQTYYQMGEFNQYPPFIMNPDVSGVYQNVAVYDSEGNFVGIGTITRFEGKMLHYSADIEWNEPEEPEEPVTNETPEENEYHYEDIEITSEETNTTEEINETEEVIEEPEEVVEEPANNTTDEIINVTAEANNTTEEVNNTSAEINETANNNTIEDEDNTTEDEEQEGIPMEVTGGITSALVFALIILLVLGLAYRDNQQ